jgi:hypothetical protein
MRRGAATKYQTISAGLYRSEQWAVAHHPLRLLLPRCERAPLGFCGPATVGLGAVFSSHSFRAVPWASGRRVRGL